MRAEAISKVTCDVRAVYFEACNLRPQFRTHFLANWQEITNLLLLSILSELGGFFKGGFCGFSM